MDDLQAIQRLKAGDIGGLEILVTRYQTKAMRVAFLIAHDEMLAEDIVQDTFVRIYQRVNHCDPSRPFEPYLLRSLVNAALNVAQKADRNLSFEGDLDQVKGLLFQAASVESDVEYIQLKQRIVAALAGPEPRQRAVVIQRYYLEWRKTCNEKLQSTSVHHPKPREEKPALLNKKTIAGFSQKKRG